MCSEARSDLLDTVWTSSLKQMSVQTQVSCSDTALLFRSHLLPGLQQLLVAAGAEEAAVRVALHQLVDVLLQGEQKGGSPSNSVVYRFSLLCLKEQKVSGGSPVRPQRCSGRGL